MAHTEEFPDVAAADLAGTDYLYVRRSVLPIGSRDARFGFPALLRSFLNLSVTVDKLIYGSGTNALSLTDLTALGRSLIGRATAALMRGDLGFLTATSALDFGSISASASADLTIAVPGATVGDAVFVGLPAAPTAGIVFQGFVSTADTVTIRAMNITGSGVDPASATYRATVVKSA